MADTWLILETSGRGGRVGLAVDRRFIGGTNLDVSRRHNRDLLPAAAALLSAAGLVIKQLTGVMVSAGPGSFTGLRVGLMTAKTLAYALNCRLVAVPTFHAIAAQTPPNVERVDVISDALQGQVYHQRFGWPNTEGIRPVMSELQIVSYDTLAVSLEQGSAVAGPGLELYGPRLPEGMIVLSAQPEADILQAVFEVGLTLPDATAEERLALEPIYLRGSSAEEKARAAAAKAAT